MLSSALPIAKAEPKTLDLVVERYEFNAGLFRDRQRAFYKAAKVAETLLYVDVAGALILDTVKGWGSSGPEYPQPQEVDDGFARWRQKWHIPPREYQEGIRWKPLDGMQQFDVKTKTRRRGELHRGVVEMVSYVWDDGPSVVSSSDGRLGCLLDIIARRREEGQIILAETGRTTIPMDRNKKGDIDNVFLFKDGEQFEVSGLSFPPNEKGDTSYKPIELTPIDINERRRACEYRDR